MGTRKKGVDYFQEFRVCERNFYWIIRKFRIILMRIIGGCFCERQCMPGIQPHHLTLSVTMHISMTSRPTLFKLLIFNHIDHVSHYFCKIWPLHADDMNSILKWNYYLSFETGFSRFAMAKVVMILMASRPKSGVFSGFAEALAAARAMATPAGWSYRTSVWTELSAGRARTY